MSPLPGGHDYDFDLSIRPAPSSNAWVDRHELEAWLATLPGVRRHEVKGFVMDSPLGRWLEIRPQWREAGGYPRDGGERVNHIHLHFPASARGPNIDHDYMETAFAIADHLGWRVHDDTDSDDWVSREMLDAWWSRHRKKPWWKFW